MSDIPVDETGPIEEVEPVQKKPERIEVTKPCKSSLGDDVHHDPAEAVGIPMDDLKTFSETMDKSPDLNYAADPDGRRWMEFLAQAAMHFARGGSFTNSLEREDSIWRQFVDNEGEELVPGRPRISGGGDGQRLSGDRAIFRITSAVGLGTVVQIPLWHTGIWITLRAPAESELLELDRRIAEEKIDLGRHTNGMVFSNSSVYINSHLMNFILAHVYDSTLKGGSAKRLKEIIRVTDLNVLIWGMLCAIYPNGYNYSQPCTTNPEVCQHVTSELLNISKLCWTDNSALTTKQRLHMAKRTEKFTVEQVKEYQSEHTHGIPRTIKVHDELSVKFHVPSLADYELSGFKWVDGIVRMVEDAFGVELVGDARNDYINQQGRATALRQYSQWISEIHLANGDLVDDQETIETIMGHLSADREVSNKIFEGVGKFIDDATISLIAIPKYDCPNCGESQGVEESRYPHLIPLGVSQLFFTLLDQRLHKLLQAES